MPAPRFPRSPLATFLSDRLGCVDELPVAGREVDGPEIGRGIYEFEGDGEDGVLRFADGDDVAGDFGSRAGVDEGELMAARKFEAGFEQAAVGVDYQGESVEGDEAAVVEASFDEQANL